MNRLIIFTGAGISHESGIPTFRSGNDALWNNYRVEDLCDISSFKKNYEIVHQFYNERRVKLKNVEPNLAHIAIAELQKRFGSRVELMTTNVDDLHERAGSTDVIHLHGNISELIDCKSGEIIPIGYEPFDYVNSSRNVKPNVVMFGESAPRYSDLYCLLETLSHKDMVLVIGSSEVVIQFCLESFRYSYGQSKIFYIDPTDLNPYEDMVLGGEFKPYTEHYKIGAVEAFKKGSVILKLIERHMQSD